MKRTTILAALLVAVSLISTGCGTSDSIKSITITSTSSNLEVYGEGGTLQLQVNANYNSGKTVPVTNQATFVLTPLGTDDGGNALPNPYTTPPSTIQINSTGLVTAITPFICTWVVTSAPGATPITYAISGSYQVVATYKGMSSAPQFIPVASADINVAGATCGPVPTT